MSKTSLDNHVMCHIDVATLFLENEICKSSGVASTRSPLRGIVEVVEELQQDKEIV
jgi:hypothetical protein